MLRLGSEMQNHSGPYEKNADKNQNLSPSTEGSARDQNSPLRSKNPSFVN